MPVREINSTIFFPINLNIQVFKSHPGSLTEEGSGVFKTRIKNYNTG